MSSDIIVNVNSRETRVAILEDGRLAELMYDRGESVVGNIYLGKVENVVQGLDAAFVDCGIEKNVFLHVSDALEEEPSREQMRHKMNGFPPIGEVLKPGQTVLVQVTKGPVESKGARATRRISLPGRFLVLTTDGRGRTGVSKKIADDKERARLRDLANEVKPEGFGVIVRTRAEGAQRKELEDDVRFLLKLWRTIQAKGRSAKAPALIHEDLSLVFEVVRDVLTVNTGRFVIDHKPTYDKVLNVLDNIDPRLRDCVELYRGEEPIFTHFGIEEQIDRALNPRVWLPHGGYIAIHTTEALTTIDVNTGRYTGSRLEDTVLRTNLEAAEEIARQLRLRDVGGIIVIDFIDMDKRQHREQVLTTLRRAFARDRMKTRIMHITRLGLVEMTRKRTQESLQQQLTCPCPFCRGNGFVLSPETVASRIAEELRLRGRRHEAECFAVLAEPKVALSLVGPGGAAVEALEAECGVPLYVRCQPSLHPERYEIIPHTIEEAEFLHPRPQEGRRLTLEPSNALGIPSSGLVAQVNGLLVEVPEVSPSFQGTVKVRVTSSKRSLVRATPWGGAEAVEHTEPGETPPAAPPPEQEAQPCPAAPVTEAPAEPEEAQQQPEEPQRRSSRRGRRRSAPPSPAQAPQPSEEPAEPETSEPQTADAAPEEPPSQSLPAQSQEEAAAAPEPTPAKKRATRRRRGSASTAATRETPSATPPPPAEGPPQDQPTPETELGSEPHAEPTVALEPAPEPEVQPEPFAQAEGEPQTLPETPPDQETAEAKSKPSRRGRRKTSGTSVRRQGTETESEEASSGIASSDAEQ